MCESVCAGFRRKFVAEARFIQIVGAIQLLLAAWALLSSVSAGTQPLVACELRTWDADVASSSAYIDHMRWRSKSWRHRRLSVEKLRG